MVYHQNTIQGKPKNGWVIKIKSIFTFLEPKKFKRTKRQKEIHILHKFFFPRNWYLLQILLVIQLGTIFLIVFNENKIKTFWIVFWRHFHEKSKKWSSKSHSIYQAIQTQCLQRPACCQIIKSESHCYSSLVISSLCYS